MRRENPHTRIVLKDSKNENQGVGAETNKIQRTYKHPYESYYLASVFFKYPNTGRHRFSIWDAPYPLLFYETLTMIKVSQRKQGR